MNEQTQPVLGYRFGPFEADLSSGELRKSGIRLRLQEKPFQLLRILLQNAPEPVSREELFRQLWPGDTFVDFDNSLNTAVNKLRQVLNDPAECARYIETLPRKGYRFVFTPEPIRSGEFSPAVQPVPMPSPVADPSLDSPRASAPSASPRWLLPFQRRSFSRRIVAGVVFALLVASSVWWGYKANRSESNSTANIAPRTRLAVLPFQDLSLTDRKEYLSEGVTEEITSQLARLDSEKLGVIARTSAAQFTQRSINAKEIGRALGADYLLEGSIQQDAGRVRIHAQLIRVSDQTHLWADTFDRPWDGWLTVQTEVARRVARSLAIELLPGQRLALERASTTNAAAYEYFWQARQALYEKKTDSFDRTENLLRRAIEIDPNYALAYATLSQTYGFRVRPGSPDAEEWKSRSESAARKALELDPMLAEGHVAMARAHFDAWRWNEVDEELTRALRLNGNDPGTRFFYAKFLSSRGRHQEALEHVLRAVELDPRSLDSVGFFYLAAGNYRKAQSEAERLLASGRREFDGRWMLGSSLLAQGQVEAAEKELERARKLNNQAAPMLVDLATAYWRGGRRDRALEIARILENSGPNFSFLVATLYASFEQPERALDFLERAYEARSPSLMSLGTRREFEPLRTHPRFIRLQQRVGLRSLQ